MPRPHVPCTHYMCKGEGGIPVAHAWGHSTGILHQHLLETENESECWKGDRAETEPSTNPRSSRSQGRERHSGSKGQLRPTDLTSTQAHRSRGPSSGFMGKHPRACGRGPGPGEWKARKEGCSKEREQAVQEGTRAQGCWILHVGWDSITRANGRFLRSQVLAATLTSQPG